MKILFVTWDGPDLAYLEGLFVPIFEALRPRGFHFDVLQFRWGEAEEGERIRRRCERAGLGYQEAVVRRYPPAVGPLLTALAGGHKIRAALRRFGSDAVMPRSVLPAVAAAVGKVHALRPTVYDADGLELDERVEFAGLSPTSLSYRWLRDVEAQAVRRATAVLTRTSIAQDILRARAGAGFERQPMFIVTNGREPKEFHPFDGPTRLAVRHEIGLSGRVPLIVYAGSVGYRYDTGRIGALARAISARAPEARLLILTGNPRAASAELGLGQCPDLAAMTRIMRVEPGEVARYLAAGDLGTAYVRPSFSTQAVAPVKIGEYLLCGLPVVGAAAVGNNASAVERGLFLDAPEDVERAASWFLGEVLPNRERIRQDARALGVQNYSLARSVADYEAALQSLKSLSEVGMRALPGPPPAGLKKRS